MENNTQNPRPQKQRKKIPPKDIILIALAVLVMFRIDWANMNSFHYLILFLLLLCFMLRWSNMRKENQRKQAMLQRQAELEAKKAAETPAETVADADISVLDAPASVETEEPESITEEKTTE